MKATDIKRIKDRQTGAEYRVYDVTNESKSGFPIPAGEEILWCVATSRPNIIKQFDVFLSIPFRSLHMFFDVLLTKD